MRKATEEAASGSDASAEAEKLVSEAALPPVENMTQELGDLGSPKGDEKQVEAIVTAFSQTVEKLEADPESVTADSFAAANQMAEAYGLTDCTI